MVFKGAVSSHQSNTRSSDNSAKYHVEVHAKQAGMPEGLSRVLDILATAVQPASVEPGGTKQALLAAEAANQPAARRIGA